MLISTLADKLTICSCIQIAHVRFLRSALTAAGATPVNCPRLSLSPATFTAAATGKMRAVPVASCSFSKANSPQMARIGLLAAAVSATGTIDPASVFNPYSSDAAFYLGAYIFEDLGVTAYKGAVQVLQVRSPCDAATKTN